METPPLVRRALELAAAHGFESSCRPEDGALLHVLAARRGIVRAAEIGTGAGVGAAWIASALPPGVPFFTAEIDPELAARAAELFADDPDVTRARRVVAGDLAAGGARSTCSSSTEARRRTTSRPSSGSSPRGGTAVLDDFWHDPALPDQRRDSWLEHPLLATVEVWVTPERRALVAVRR